MLRAMNSLNILSGLTTTPPTTPPRSRTSSSANIVETLPSGQDGQSEYGSLSEKLAHIKTEDVADERSTEHVALDEKTPLLGMSEDGGAKQQGAGNGWRIHRRIADAVVYSFKMVYRTVTAPGRYVIACFYDDHGHFSAMMPLRNFKSLMSRRRRKSTVTAPGFTALEGEAPRDPKLIRRTSEKRSPSIDSISSGTSYATSDAETDREQKEDSPARHTRSKTAQAAQQKDEIKPQNKSIRIKLHNDEALRKRKAQKAQQRAGASPEDVDKIASSLKSPSSPSAASSKLRYPRTPALPRPLVPRRQPSYTMSYSLEAPKKTLIIDLDETLIHSMAKGGRMSSGHMVEVRLNSPMSMPAILYFVHERPHCHDFLRKVAKWYNLIVFTASVQEYADPVIDWLERERKYFSGRYYRQHCTFRNGAYIKDLAQVEPDLSRVAILDNSPMSYIFHEDNAIPIEGWISDPTDHELLHLIPLLEGLQYVTDLRALLALRQGQGMIGGGDSEARPERAQQA